MRKQITKTIQVLKSGPMKQVGLPKVRNEMNLCLEVLR